MLVAATTVATLLAFVPEPPAAAERPHAVTVTTAPLYVTWNVGHDPGGASDALNLNPESTLTGLGIELAYGHRFHRRFELVGSLEYMRPGLVTQPSFQVFRATVTPFLVLATRRYDFSLGPRVGAGALLVRGEPGFQGTATLVLRNRVWVHPALALVLALSSGVHPGNTTYEMVSARIGLAGRW